MKKVVILSCLLISFQLWAQPLLVKEIPGETHSYVGTSNLLFFLSSQSDTLWRSDGTSAGTIILKTGLNSARSITVVGNQVYFIDDGGAGNRLWISNGTQAGTISIANLSEISSLQSFNNLLVFVGKNANGRELWKSNGTASGTVMVKNINSGSADGLNYGTEFEPVGSFVYFAANNGINGSELWKSDGTSSGTTLVKDIVQGANSSNPHRLNKTGNNLIFDTQSPDFTMWVSNGTSSGTKILFEYLFTGYERYPSIDINGTLYFFLSNPGGVSLWKSDGTTAGTVFANYSGYVMQMFNANGYLVISHNYEENWDLTYKNANSDNFNLIKFGYWNHSVVTMGNYVFFNDDSYNEFGDPEIIRDLWQAKIPGGANSMIELFPYINTHFEYSGNFAVVGNTLYFTSSKDQTSRFLYKYTPMDFGIRTFTLVDSQTDNDIKSLKNGDTIFTDQHVNIRANTFGNVNSVKFYVKDSPFSLENSAPYSLAGDNSGNYNEWNKPSGLVKITAVPYTQGGASGLAGMPASFVLHIISPRDTIKPQVNFTLVNAETNEDIGPLTDGQIINLNLLPTSQLNIRANSTFPNTQSVKFDFAGTTFDRVENEEPYSLFGDANGDYNAWCCPSSGSYTLSATPFSGNQATGNSGVGATITFNLTNEFQNGIYRISMKYNPNMVWDLRGGFPYDGTEVLQYPYHGGGNQQWDIQSTGNGYYSIRSVYTGKYLQVSSAQDGEYIVQWSPSASNNQQWNIISLGNGYFKVINKYSQKCADLTHVPENNEIVQWTCNNTDNQKFKFELYPNNTLMRSASLISSQVDAEVYPNPFLDEINISFNGDFSYDILSIEGKSLFQGSGNNIVNIPLDGFPGGFYIIQIKCLSGTKVFKVFKNL